jgi:hypothetical protein
VEEAVSKNKIAFCRTRTVWLVREDSVYPAIQLFEDEASAQEFCRLRPPGDAWHEPAEYEVVRLARAGRKP